MPDIVVDTYDSASAVPADDWDSLTDGATTYSAYGWLRVREQELPDHGVFRALLARADGRAVRGMEAYCFDTPPHRLYAPSAMLAGLVPDGKASDLDEGPIIVAAGWSEFRGQSPVRPGTDEATKAASLRGLIQEVTSWLDCQRGVAVFAYVPGALAAAIRDAVGRDGCLTLFAEAECLLNTSWESFDEYLAWLPRNRRTRARSEIKKFYDSGQTVEEYRLSEVLDVIIPLNGQLMRKYGHGFSDAQLLAIYAGQAKWLDEYSSVLMSRDPGGSTTGFCLRYTAQSRSYSRIAGFDYARASHAEYFNLMIYEPIRRGVLGTVRELNLGLGTYEAKLGRGACPEPLFHVFIRHGVVREIPSSAVEQQNEEELSGFNREFGHLIIGDAQVRDWSEYL